MLRELTETQDQLVQSQRVAATASLAAGIAHHINNPLTSVLGYLQILGSRLRKSGDHPELLELLATAEDQSVRIKDIVSTLQALAEDQAAKTSDPVSVPETIEQALKVVEEENARIGIEVVRDFEPSLPGVMGSQNRLHLLLLYVFKNAREAMPDGGRLLVSTAATEDKTVTITVKDNGEGIASENLSRIFDPFFTTKRDKRHKGLGLSIAHRIVQEHGGSIRATSTVGEGTTIRITLPAKRSWAHLV